eukprot:4300783-Amphidinium_carterae.1
MGLNFLAKKHRICRLGNHSPGRRTRDDGEGEWYTFQRGLKWSLAYFKHCTFTTAIIAMRKACFNYTAYIEERGMTLNPVTRSKRCLGCEKKRNNAKQAKSITCYPRLFQSLTDHLESDGCVQDFIRGVSDLRFEKFYNLNDVMKKWWKRRKRAFV